MKAARWHGVKDIRVEDIDTPTPGPGEVAIKVAWTGICGSDLHEYLAGPIFVPVGDEHPLSHDKAPITMGHEYSGTVVELGAVLRGRGVAVVIVEAAAAPLGRAVPAHLAARLHDRHRAAGVGIHKAR